MVGLAGSGGCSLSLPVQTGGNVMIKQSIKGLVAMAVSVTSLAMVPSTVQAQNIRNLYVDNNCPYPIRMFIYHRHRGEGWATHGWFSLDAGAQRVQLTYADGRPMGHEEGTDLYFYAEVTRGRTDIFWEGDTRVNFSGVNYGVMQSAPLRVERNQMYTWLNCDNR